jgi:replicative DNA helicase
VTAISDALARLEAEDFLLDSHQRIYRVILDLLSMGEEIDTLTVMAALSRRKELDSVGGRDYLLFLTEGIPRHPNIEAYVRIVKDKSTLRKLLGVFNEGMATAADQSEDGIKVATDAIAHISEVIENSQVKTEVFDSPTMAMDAAKRLLDNPKMEAAIALGFKPLDEFTGGGIRLGELWVIGASPSRGKTTLARQGVKHAIRDGIPCYVHSGEMTKESWYDVTACLLVDMMTWKIREPWLLNSYEKDMMRAGLKELSSLPLYISDAGGIHIDKLLWNASRAIQQHKIKLFVIDYAQIIRAHGKDERERVSAVAQKLRVFAKDNNVATILLSQSPRPEGRSINSRPNMFALKESGTLEEAAHTVVLPFRLVDTETNAFIGEDELIIGKQRWGPIGSVPCRLDGKYLKFVERQTDAQQ